jgi:hypothetical protein
MRVSHPYLGQEGADNQPLILRTMRLDMDQSQPCINPPSETSNTGADSSNSHAQRVESPSTRLFP